MTNNRVTVHMTRSQLQNLVDVASVGLANWDALSNNEMKAGFDHGSASSAVERLKRALAKVEAQRNYDDEAQGQSNG